jgi:3-deoxy-D-manno-octulosonate 8-phosphate phosphatase (KDO 8-P phosphatase)
MVPGASRIRVVLFDVDGVLTDGKILLHADGTESKRFDIRDGTGILWAERAGLTVGLLSARTSTATAQRAAQLGISLVYQGVASKLDTYEEVLRREAVTDPEVAYMGDDLLDLPVLARVGLAAAPADAVAEVRERVDWVSNRAGGDGAARELVEMILRAQGKWDSIVASYAELRDELAASEMPVGVPSAGGPRDAVGVTPERSGARASGAAVPPPLRYGALGRSQSEGQGPRDLKND